MKILPPVLKDIIPFGSATLLKNNQNTRASNCPTVLGKLLEVMHSSAFSPASKKPLSKEDWGPAGGAGAWRKRGLGPGKGSEGLGSLRGWGPDALGGLRPGGDLTLFGGRKIVLLPSEHQQFCQYDALV